MKSILLTTTAIVAFAGAAVADGHAGVSFSGDFTLGFNDDNDDVDSASATSAGKIGDNDGFYWEGDLNVTGTAALDNGVTASASWEFDITDEDNGQPISSDGVLLSLTTDNAGLYLGDTSFAAETQWKSAGDMEADGFSEADGENVLRGDVSVAGIDASISLALGNADGGLVAEDTTEDYDQLSFGASGDLGMFSFAVAYQEESEFAPYFSAENGDFNDSEIFGISAGVSVAGADITVAYASDETLDENSTGIQVSYPFGPITGTVYYVAEDDGSDEDNYGATVAYADGPIAVTLDYDYDQGVNKVGLDGTYDLGNGFTIGAGMYDQSDDATDANNGTDFYVAGMYDLGGGAELLVTYADAETAGAIADDEVGGPDYQVGTTVEVSFSF
ncbi:porin [Yoonia sp. R78084]|uniref:porin n=1 Tax=Yoonia sp. R78084 TaxID=3093869 RepID=UPI0037DD6B6B